MEVNPDDDGDEAPREKEKAEKVTGKGRGWTLQEVATYQRTGKLPSHAGAGGKGGGGEAMEY